MVRSNQMQKSATSQVLQGQFPCSKKQITCSNIMKQMSSAYAMDTAGN